MQTITDAMESRWTANQTEFYLDCLEREQAEVEAWDAEYPNWRLMSLDPEIRTSLIDEVIDSNFE